MGHVAQLDRAAPRKGWVIQQQEENMVSVIIV